MRSVLTFLALTLVLGAVPAHADPVVLTSGGFFYQRQEAFIAHASGTGGAINAAYGFWAEFWYPPYATACSTCVPGSSFEASLSERMFEDPATEHEFVGTFHVGDAVFTITSFVFTIASEAVRVPAENGVSFSNSARFTLDGTATGTSASGQTTAVDLRGTGLVRLGFHSGSWFSSEYRFDDAAPTPEPGSLLLLASGGAWIATRVRRRARGGTAS